MSTKEKIIYFCFFIAAIVIIAVVLFVLFFNTTTTPANNLSPTPTTAQGQPTITPTLPPQESSTDAANMVENKQPLSSSDQGIRTSLISQTDSKGIIKHTNEYNIHYVSSADVFQIEILTSSVTTVTNDAVAWLRSLGLTDSGICNLPLIVYRDPKAFDPKLTTGLEFYPLPISCQQ